FCRHYQVEPTFLQSLGEFGLIELKEVENEKYIHKDALQALEKFIHLHYDLNINMEGLDAIEQLLQRVKEMHMELIRLRSRLNIYE
ncbi:MAG: chaperone modulator CbpM, partial [Chitinophagales bacterium]